MKYALFGMIGLGLLITSAHAQPAARPAPAPVEVTLATFAAGTAEAGAPAARIARPVDLEDDDSGDYMKHMTPAELEQLYAKHDADVARLMAAAPDQRLAEAAFLLDPETGEAISIGLIAF